MDCFTAEYSKAANFLGLEQFQDGIAPSEKSPPPPRDHISYLSYLRSTVGSIEWALTSLL